MDPATSNFLASLGARHSGKPTPPSPAPASSRAATISDPTVLGPIALRVLVARQRARLSMSAVARMAGCNLKSVQRLERRRPIGVELIRQIAAALNVDLNALLPKEGSTDV